MKGGSGGKRCKVVKRCKEELRDSKANYALFVEGDQRKSHITISVDLYSFIYYILHISRIFSKITVWIISYKNVNVLFEDFLVGSKMAGAECYPYKIFIKTEYS